MADFIKDIVSNLVSRFVDLSIDERVNDYRSNFTQYQNMMTQVTMESDKALMTFSLAALAALAALNDKVFEPHGWISFITLVCFITVVALVIVGYSISKALIKDAQQIMTRNFQSSLKTPLNRGLDKVKFAKLSKVLNFMSVTFFVIGMILFIALMGLYIKGV